MNTTSYEYKYYYIHAPQTVSRFVVDKHHFKIVCYEITKSILRFMYSVYVFCLYLWIEKSLFNDFIDICERLS